MHSGSEYSSCDVRALRLSKPSENVLPVISDWDHALIYSIADATAHHLENNYCEGFGVFPSADPDSNYFNQVWSRDLAHAAGNYFAEAHPKALLDSFATIFKHQRKDGTLPSRVEREYLTIRFIPFLKPWSKQIFNLIEKGIFGRSERAAYEGLMLGGEDTLPALIIGVGEFFLSSKTGHDFAMYHYNSMNRAMETFRRKTDPADGLAVMTRNNPDWADTITRKGKLGGVNIWWARSLRLMQYMANALGYADQAEQYKREFHMVKKNILAKLYNRSGGYFQAEEHDTRLDTVASIFGALYLLNAEEAVCVEEALDASVRKPMGLKNFAPPYSRHFIRWNAEWSYHNRNVWPWVTCENIQVKIKIALQHTVPAVREKYQREAIYDLVKMARLFRTAGGAGEVFDPNIPQLAQTKKYTPPKHFMGSMAAYQGAYLQLKRLGWV